MRVLLSAYGSRGDVELVVGLVVQLRALGAQARGCAPPDCSATEDYHALVATGEVPAGGWR